MYAFLIVIAAARIALPFPDAAPGHHECLRGPFRGITVTSAVGAIVGEVDRGDWGCARERKQEGRTAIASGDEPNAPADVPLPPPTDVCLTPAFPNPAQARATRLQFTLPQSARVTLVIHGQTFRRGPKRVFEVRTLVDGTLAAGVHQVVWDTRDASGAPVPPGIYRAVLHTGVGSLCGDIQVP